MKNYDYVIYGAGPSGLTLAYLLAKNKFKVALIEKDIDIGGCWKVEWQDDKYFTEHSPRVLIDTKSGFYNLLKQIGFDYENETVPTYGKLFETNYKLFNFFIRNLSLSDYFKLLFSSKKNLTVTEWLNKNNFSEKAKKAFTIFSILLANSPDKLLTSELFNERGFPVMFLQFKNNSKWLSMLKEKLLDLNVDLILNHSLDNLEYDKSVKRVSYGIIRDNEMWSGKNVKYIYGKNHLVTFPPKAMYDFLLKQKEIIRNNWINLKGERLDKWLEDSTYYSFGFQLHFKESKFDNPKLDIKNKEWCWSCVNEYNLILLPTSDYQEKYSYDEKVKTVWSCTIVDTNKYISKFNKTVNEMSESEIIDDISEFIYNNVGVYPYHVTIYDGVKKEYVNSKEIWISKDSAFSVGKSGVIKSKGKINNLEWIGPHNVKGITTINKSVDNVINWIKENNLNTYNLDVANSFLIIYIIIILFLIYIVYKKYRSN